MSLLNLFKEKINVSLFTTPSHAQKLFIFSKLRQFYKYDISETDFHEPQTALELAEKKAALIYKTKSTHFLTNGSTSGIIASILACVSQGDKVLIWEKAHPAHKNAVELAGAIPVFYQLEKDEEWGIYKQTPIEEIEQNFNKEKPKAIIITSPSYEGIVSDIKRLKEICTKNGAYLIVDEAHGALYPFCDKLPKSAIYQGADFVIQSLHKTAGGLNPTALLHCNLDIEVKQALDKITTTSPSYPLLASIEKNINYLNSSKGRNSILELIKNINALKNNTQSCEFHPTNDPTKILVKASGLSGFKLSELLFDNKIEDEKTNEVSTMLLCGIGTDKKKLNRLQKVLKDINAKTSFESIEIL